MKSLLVYLKDYKKETILAPLFKLLEAVFELLIPIIMKMMIDVGINNGDKIYIIKMCGLMVFLGVIGLICSITAQYFSAKAAVGFATKVRFNLFEHIESLGFSEMDNLGVSTMITRMTSDINQIQTGVNLVLRLLMRSPFIVFGAMIAEFTIDVQQALVFVIVIPILFVIVLGIMFISIPYYKKVQGQLDQVLGIARENLIGVRVLRAFNKEQEERTHFNENNETLTRLQLFVGRILTVMNPLTYIVINGAIVILLWSGGKQVNIGLLTTGAVVALVNYMSQILVELVKLANLIITVTKAVACGKRVQSVFELKPSISKEDKEKELVVLNRGEDKAPFIEFKQVSLKYSEQGDEALSNLSFKVEKGQTIGIIGGTGSGKSSLVHLIPRFYDATSGEILIEGKNIKEYGVNQLRERIGMAMQKSVLFKGTIKENLLFGNKKASAKDIEEALHISQAAEFVTQKQAGLESEVEQEGKNLSGGQRQRLNIARALVRRPEILILDDSTSALDYATEAKLRQAIKEMENKPTLFIVSQRASVVQYADQILVLDNGKIVGKGTHEELLETCKLYQEIYYV